MLSGSIPWRLLCFVLVIRTYCPDISTPERIEHFSKFLSQMYCYETEQTAQDQCITEVKETVKSALLLINQTSHLFNVDSLRKFTNALLKYITDHFNPKSSDERTENSDSLIFARPSEDMEGDVIVTMTDLIKKAQNEYEKNLPDNYKKEATKTLNKIKFHRRNTKSFCDLEFGIHPSTVIRHIKNIANLTKMPGDMQEMLERSVEVKDGNGKIAESVPISADGVVHYVLIAAVRKANDSFDLGIALFSVDYQISTKLFQPNEEAVREFISFTNNTNVDEVGELSFEGGEQIHAYFYGKAIEMFMYKCPTLLSGLQKIRKDFQSS